MNSGEPVVPDDPIGFIQDCVQSGRIYWTYHVNMRIRERSIPSTDLPFKVGVSLEITSTLRVDRSKVVNYLLNPVTSRGKAAFFFRMGFQQDRWQDLAQTLKEQALSSEVSAVVESRYGTRYSVDGLLKTPDDRSPSPRLRTIWIEEPGSEAWRLVTAHPI